MSNSLLSLHIGSHHIHMAACVLTQENGFKLLSSAKGVVQGVEPLNAGILSRSIAQVLKRVLRKGSIEKVVLSVSSSWINHDTVTTSIQKDHSRYQFTYQDQQQCIQKAKALSDGVVMHAIPVSFQLNGHDVVSPIGAFGQRLAVRTHLISIKEHRLACLLDALNTLGLHLSALVCPSLSASQVYASKEELQDGIILVEVSSALTTFSVFQYGVLQRLITVPIGGDKFTNDLAVCLKYSFFEAEELKCGLGSLLSTQDPIVRDILFSRFKEWAYLSQEAIQGLAMPLVIYGAPTWMPGFFSLFEKQIWQPLRQGVLPVFRPQIAEPLAIPLGAVLYALSVKALLYQPDLSIKKQIQDWVHHFF